MQQPGTDIPMNGNPVHDMQIVGGMGFTLSKAPVARELRYVQKNYPQWQLPSLVSYSLTYMLFVITELMIMQVSASPNVLKPWQNARGSKFTVVSFL